jgi:predicted nuclease of predicted toxin-antitoxin system
MRLLLDENVAPAVAPRLSIDGFDVRLAADARGRGSADSALIEFAVAQGRTIITHDRDFGLLAARRAEQGLPRCSLLLLRPGAASVEEVLQAIHETRSLANGEREGWFAVAALRDGRATIRFRGA